MYEYTASSLSKTLAIINLIAGIIVGIVCGIVFAVQTTFYEFIENDYAFNFALASAIWALTLCTSIALYLCCRHFRNQEETNETLYKIARRLENIESNTKKED